jgi:hypothetical protein
MARMLTHREHFEPMLDAIGVPHAAN